MIGSGICKKKRGAQSGNCEEMEQAVASTLPNALQLLDTAIYPT
jgi:hypothetical protein